ncbi:MAG: agmatinase family protein [Acidobacteria bacterium]|nr:agmatinase family protein [Acidobacteriota bacterium]
MSLPYPDPRWPRASAWLAGECEKAPAGRLAVLGAPLRLGSITPGDCHLAPQAIRSALERFSTCEVAAGCDVRRLEAADHGDLELAEKRPEEALEPLSRAVSHALETAEALVLLGGDNSITRPGCHGLADALDLCGLLTLDAHFDLRDLDNGLTNGNAVRALLADGLPGVQIAQIGIQSFANSQAYMEVAKQAGIRAVAVDEVRERGIRAVVEDALRSLSQAVEVIYVDLDLDVLDQAFAPATPGARPGGLTPHEVRQAARLCGLHPKVRVLDLVEIDPSRDIRDATARAAAACLLSFASGVLGRIEASE